MKHLMIVLLMLGELGCVTPSPGKRAEFSSSSAEAGISASSPPLTPGMEQKARSSEMNSYQEIEALYSRNALDTAQNRIFIFNKKYPSSPLAASIQNISGLIALRSKSYSAASEHFKKSIAIGPKNSSFSQYILYNLASSYWEGGQLDDAFQTANQIKPENLDPANRLKVRYLKANLLRRRALFVDSLKELLSSAQDLSSLEMRDSSSAYVKLLDQNLDEVTDLATLEKLYVENAASAFADVLLFRLGSQEILLGSLGKGEGHLKALMSQFPQSRFFSQASDLLNLTPAQSSVEQRTIGILLPLKGKFSKYGQKSLQGIELALDIFNLSEPDPRINLVIEDSGEEPEQAVNALNKLVFKHHVIAVIGPLLTKGTDQVSQRAQELGVPLISLSRHVGAQYDYVFQGGLTQQLQASEIARYAIEHLGMHKFAIIFSRDKLSIEISEKFWDAVESLGGSIVGAESYSSGETDFRHVVDKLSGLDNPLFRQDELDLLAHEREVNHITRQTRKTEQFYSLKPIVDFDAVFIPDDPKVAGQILPTFAYKDIDEIYFLGSSSWNSLEFLQRAQPYVENAYFVDAFFADSQTSLVKNFISKYKSTFGQEPTSLEAVAYDAGMILRSMISQADPAKSRSEMRDRLRGVVRYPGITGTISCKEGRFQRDLRVLTSKKGQIVEAI